MPEFAQQQRQAQNSHRVSPSRPDLRNFQLALSGDPLLIQQQALGNQAMQRLLYSRVIQAKLKISQPGDKYEQEADRVAEEVMRMPDSEVSDISKSPTKIQAKCAVCASSGGLCPKCAEEEEGIQRKSLASTVTPLVQHQNEISEFKEDEEKILQTKEEPNQAPEVIPGVQAKINRMRGGGQSLPESIRAFFEPRFGYDFSEVQVHTDAQATEVAGAINARAFTIGQDIVFGAGQFEPWTTAGRRLLAHELTHTIQQAKRVEQPLSNIVNSIVQQNGDRRGWTASTLRRQPETCPPDRTEEPEHAGTCPDIERKSDEEERFARLGLHDEVIVSNTCYLLSNFGIGRAEFVGVPETLNEVADLLEIDRNITVHITGFADCKGRAEQNANLRSNRAAAVEDYVTSVLSVAPQRVFIETSAVTEYVDTNATAEGRARNRGVAIYLEHGPSVPPITPKEQAVNLARQDCFALHDIITTANIPKAATLFLRIYECLSCSFVVAIDDGLFQDPIWVARVNHFAVERLKKAFTSPPPNYKKVFSSPVCQGHSREDSLSCSADIGKIHLEVDLRDALKFAGCSSEVNRSDYEKMIPLFEACNRDIFAELFPRGRRFAEVFAIPVIKQQRNKAWSDAGCTD